VKAIDRKILNRVRADCSLQLALLEDVLNRWKSNAHGRSHQRHPENEIRDLQLARNDCMCTVSRLERMLT
jgi:hypothetical protein